MKDNLLRNAFFLIIAGVFLLVINMIVVNAVQPLSVQIKELKGVSLNKSPQNTVIYVNDDKIVAELKSISDRLGVLEKKLSSVGAKQNQAAGCGGAQAQQDPNKVYDIKIGDSPVMGSKDARVTITAFMDLQCPFCTRFYPPVKEIVKQYNGKVNFVMKNYPLSFHKSAVGAAKLAFAANEQGKYYEMVELLLNNGAKVTDDKIKEYAQAAGLNHKKLVNDLKNKDAQYQKYIDADMALAQQAAINGTPTFYINGKKTAARDVESYKAEIDKILSQKK